jgi:hypothetical protein
MTRLSRLHIPDPSLAKTFLRGDHLTTRDPMQENKQGTSGRSQVPQADPYVTILHNSDKRRDREKQQTTWGLSRCKNIHKTWSIVLWTSLQNRARLKDSITRYYIEENGMTGRQRPTLDDKGSKSHQSLVVPNTVSRHCDNLYRKTVSLLHLG